MARENWEAGFYCPVNNLQTRYVFIAWRPMTREHLGVEFNCQKNKDKGTFRDMVLLFGKDWQGTFVVLALLPCQRQLQTWFYHPKNNDKETYADVVVALRKIDKGSFAETRVLNDVMSFRRYEWNCKFIRFYEKNSVNIYIFTVIALNRYPWSRLPSL